MSGENRDPGGHEDARSERLDQKMNPRAKKNILVEKLPDETLVYDLDRHRAHCLNPTAAFLLEQADGEKDLSELARLAEAQFEKTTTNEVVGLGMERLQRARLVEWESPSLPTQEISRKEALRKLALVGLALPAVMTIVTPVPAQAATGITPGECKKLGGTTGQCCTNQKLCITVGSKGACSGGPC